MHGKLIYNKPFAQNVLVQRINAFLVLPISVSKFWLFFAGSYFLLARTGFGQNKFFEVLFVTSSYLAIFFLTRTKTFSPLQGTKVKLAIVTL